MAWLPSCVTPVNTLTSKAWIPHTPQHHKEKLHDTVIGMVSITISVWTVLHWYGNINPFSIDYACRPRLRSRLTQGGQTCPWNPWSSGGGDSHSSFTTHACILSRAHSTTAHATASTHTRCSPTHHANRHGAAASAVRLDPLHYRRGTTRPVSYYALFQGWLLLSQPLGCLCGPTSFPTERTLGGLSRRSGLFPSRP